MTTRNLNSMLVERRVRPIYDSLDNGNNKKAVQEADRVLKKQPTLLCAKALKCLAMLRLGRESESLELLEVLESQAPVDEQTLQAMTVCYREVHRPESICKMFERAKAKEPMSEEIQNSLFFAYVRVGDYTKQKFTALSLCKINPVNQYYFWAFMSTLLQSVDNVNDLVQLCAIPSTLKNDSPPKADAQNCIKLANHLVEKFMKEDKIKDGQEVLICMVALELSHKYEEALAMLSQFGDKLDSVTVRNKKVDLLVKLERWEETNAELEAMLREEPDCWHCYLMYFDSVVRLVKDEVFDASDEKCSVVRAKNLLDELVMAQQGVEFKKRGPFLARLELFDVLLEKNFPASELLGDQERLLEEYFREFGAKECCVHDLTRYVHLPDNGIFNFLTFTYKYANLDKSRIPKNKRQLNLAASNAELGRIVGMKSFFGENDIRKCVLDEVNRYIACLPLCADAPVTEVKACDRLVLLTARTLFELWTNTDETNYLFEAIVLCEYALSQSPCNSQLKLLLLKFYHLLGGTEGAHLAYLALDLKHMQLDTLGYLHLFPLLANASYLYAAHVLNTSVKFFSHNFKESADHVTLAYKHEALTKIPEFVSIRERMTNSTHYFLSTAEKMLSELFAAPNHAGAVLLARDMGIGVNMKRIKWNDLWDNRDFSALSGAEPADRTLTNVCIYQSHVHDIVVLRIRSLLLHCIDTCLDLGKADFPSDKNRAEKAENDQLSYVRIRETLVDFVAQLEATVEPAMRTIPSPISKRFIAGPPVSRLVLMLQINYFDLVFHELKFMSSFIPIDSSDQDECQYQLDAMALFVDELFRYLRTILGSSQLQLRNAVVQVSALFVELVSLSCLLAGVCDAVLAKAKQTIAKKHRKKAPQSAVLTDSSDSFGWRFAIFNKFVNFLIGVVKTMESLLGAEEKLWSDEKVRLCELSIVNNVDDKEEREKINAIQSTVAESLRRSYTSNITQMSTVLKVKLKYLNKLKS